jgi:hypothetical protein
MNSSSSTFTTNLIDTNILDFGGNSLSSKDSSDSLNLETLFQRSAKKKIEDGEVRNVFNVNPLTNYPYSLKNSYNLDSNFSEYRLNRNFYSKNSKQPLSDLDAINSSENL